jgi:hypothetical protein
MNAVKIDKNGIVGLLFAKCNAKNVLLRAIVESKSKDKLDLANQVAEELSELELMAWEKVREAHPETVGKVCRYDGDFIVILD